MQKLGAMVVRVHAAKGLSSWLLVWCRPTAARISLSLTLSLTLIGGAIAQSGVANCGPIANHYGPFDYRTQKDRLKVVDEHHFTPEVEALIRGKSSLDIEADIAYTLHTSPNHHRALIAMTRLGEKRKMPKLPRAAYSIECYYDRAIRFVPNDTVVRALFAQYLAKNGRIGEALSQLDAAVTYAKDNPLSHYNIGLVYFDLGQYDKALVQAHKALELELDRTELSDLLKGVNQWREPAKQSPASN